MLPLDRAEVLAMANRATLTACSSFGGLMLRSLAATVLLATAHPLLAQAVRVSAPITDVRYEITADSAAVGRRQLGVSMSFHVSGNAPVVLALPAWSPGHYVLIWFARRVSQFSAESNGAQLPWKKVDYQTWEITPQSAGSVPGPFSHPADAGGPAGVWARPHFLFFQ